jgi:hypothetical protein
LRKVKGIKLKHSGHVEGDVETNQNMLCASMFSKGTVK